LEFFGDSTLALSNAPPWEKGQRVAQLVAEERTLLVLDGLEPLQHAPGPLAGQLKDPALVALLRGLAQRNPGLCIVTTRERLADLDAFRETTAPEWTLQHLSPPAGVELLRALGVQGTESEFQQVVEGVAGHALTLNLLGRYLAKAHRGDIRRRDLVNFEKADAKIQGGHAFKAMAAYEKWFADAGEDGLRALAMLRLMGLFDRPVDQGCLTALCREPVIPGFTESLVGLDEEDRNIAISSLRDCGLVSYNERESSAFAAQRIEETFLDTHPLVREYFSGQLRAKNPQAWRDGHRRLYEHLKERTPYRPEGIDGLQPLYHAVAHGCRAGLYQEACDTVYLRRILRGAEHYSWQLGAFGSELGALACFFEKPWEQPIAELSEPTQTWLLNEVAIVLGAVNRVGEALEPMRRVLSRDVRLESWEEATISAGNLSELEVTLGELSAAVDDGERAVEFANRASTDFRPMTARAILADALHQAGRPEALACFRETEAMQKQLQPDYPLLYSGRGFRYCELLLSQAERGAWRRFQGLETGVPKSELGQACSRGQPARGTKLGMGPAIRQADRCCLSLSDPGTSGTL
jgi:hypothetical protein